MKKKKEKILWKEKERKGMRNYLIFSIFTAIFLAYSGVGSLVLGADLALSTSQVETLGGNSYREIILLLNGIGIAVDAATIFTIQATISGTKYLFGVGGVWEVAEPTGILQSVLTMELGLMNNLWIALVVMVIFAIPKVCKLFGATRILGITLEDLERGVGQGLLIVMTLYVFFDSMGVGNTAYASENIASIAQKTTSTIANIIILLGLLIIMKIIHYVVSTVYLFVDIILIPVSSIPFASATIELLKSCFVLILYYLAYRHPEVFLVFAIILFIICAIIFKKAYVVVRYFKSIYVKPLVHKVWNSIWNTSTEIPLVHPKMPRKLKKLYANEPLDMALPMYSLKKYSTKELIKKYEPWWLFSQNGKLWLATTTMFGFKVKTLPLAGAKEPQLYILKSIRFFELFIIDGKIKIKNRFSTGKKKVHFVYSKEYIEHYDQIKELIGCKDFGILREEILKEKKLSKQELKEEAKMARLMKNKG